MHTRTVSLHHRGLSVYIHHQTGEKVTFAVHQTVGVIVGSVKVERTAQSKRLFQPAAEEILIDFRIAEIEYAYCDTANLVMPYADETTVGGGNRHHITLLYCRWHSGQSSGNTQG